MDYFVFGGLRWVYLGGLLRRLCDVMEYGLIEEGIKCVVDVMVSELMKAEEVSAGAGLINEMRKIIILKLKDIAQFQGLQYENVTVLLELCETG